MKKSVHVTISLRRFYSFGLLDKRTPTFPSRPRCPNQAGISKELDCDPVLIGGIEDHVHLLCRLGRTISQSDWIKELKRVSSAWLKNQAPDLRTFQWQGGYADFGVSVSNLEPVKRYIEKQEAHHRKISFQDELRLLLKKHRLEWDEKYLWD